MSANIYFDNYNEVTTMVCDGKEYKSVGNIKIDAPFNFCNANAREFLTNLGFDPNFEDAPSIPLEEFNRSGHKFLEDNKGQWDYEYTAKRIKLIFNMMADATAMGATHIRIG